MDYIIIITHFIKQQNIYNNMTPLKTFLLITLAVGIIFIVFQVFRTMHYINIGNELAKAAEKIKYSQSPSNAKMRILIIGDSTIVGTGADDPKKSLAGLVGKTFPQATLINRGINGRKAKSLRKEIESLNENFDLIMLHIGGNDIVRFTPLNELENDVNALLIAAKKKASKVTLTSSGNLGTALLLPFSIRWIFTKRTLKVREIFMRVAKNNDIMYIDLFREAKVDPFHTEPDIYYAKDYFHPSSIGYALWYERIEPIIKE
jgi:lysophospholipase L1-like esterase